ncbi:MAG TPA: MurT ligase domain-containing protein [Pseudonocardiaceae bacterium]|nr:MurT ligase domain-containing protein [Pseudonocardiaceae bacterium]
MTLRIPGVSPAAVSPPGRRRVGWWTRAAVHAGLATAGLSRRLGLGAGSIIGGRVTLALDHGALRRLAAGRPVVLVSGTNGKTTTSHLVAAALRTAGRVAHNAGGSNMADGAVAALAEAPDADYAVIEVDELHLAAVAKAVDPAVVVLLNLTRDQLDRATEVRAIASSLGGALAQHPATVVVANADDPMVVSAAAHAARTVWVAAGASWLGDAASCPRCGAILTFTDTSWDCACGLARPAPQWWIEDGKARTADEVLPLDIQLPGQVNLSNATMALAAARALGIPADRAAAALREVDVVAGRYAVVRRGAQDLRLLLAKNPGGWAGMATMVTEPRPLLVIINAREADGRDTSWLWDVPFERFAGRPVVASGERAADLGVRLSYAGVDHQTVADPLAALAALPAGRIDVVANYTAFHQFRRQLSREAAR